MQNDDLKKVVAEVSEVTSKEEDKVKLLVFTLDDEEYAVEITELQEIISMSEITHVPNTPEFIKGILNLRGSIVVVVDLEKRFHLERKEKVKQEHIVVTEINKNKFGIAVDKVKEILKVSPKKIQETPDLVSTKINVDYLKGVVVLQNKKAKKKEESRLVILLDLQKLLQEKELLSVGETLQNTDIPKNKIKINQKTL